MCNLSGKRKAPYNSWNYRTVPIEYFNSNLNNSYEVPVRSPPVEYAHHRSYIS